MSDPLFEPARGPGGPRICHAANLPAFGSVAEARDFMRTVEGDSLEQAWECSVCGLIHARYKIRPPSGATTGAGRARCATPCMDRTQRETTRRRVV